jgi:hypothetical protein
MTLLFIFITLHFIFDWLKQDRYVAENKKKDKGILMKHIWDDIFPMLCVMSVILLITGTSLLSIMFFFCINLASHKWIDQYLPAGQNSREMINYTAIDQILHIFFIYLGLLLI